MPLEDIEKIKAHYNFTARDAANLKALLPVMEPHAQGFVEAFYGDVKHFENAHKFLKDEETVKRHQKALGKWFLNLFSGHYDQAYFMELARVGRVHVDIRLSAHYVNAAMNFVRTYLLDLVKNEIKDQKECAYLTGSLEKMIDINLDILTSSYIEEERRISFISQKVESYLIQFAKRFSYGLNLVLVLALVVLGIMVMGLFVYDVTRVFAGDMEKGLLSTLGSLLMLWVVIELMDTEIYHLRGGKFAINVFISVALVAIIRKILVTSLYGGEEIGAQLTLIAAVAVLGGVYWLIAKIER